MGGTDGQSAEIHDALDTTDQLHNDISRLKRLGILTPEEDRANKEHVEKISDALTEKLPEE